MEIKVSSSSSSSSLLGLIQTQIELIHVPDPYHVDGVPGVIDKGR